jgi:hypothetical protein
MMARRTAGRLGCGGGPGRRVLVFFPPRPIMLGEAQMLQKGVSDAAHQCMPVQSGPGAALEVPEAQLSLELLMRLLTDQRALIAASARTDTRRGKLLR